MSRHNGPDTVGHVFGSLLHSTLRFPPINVPLRKDPGSPMGSIPSSCCRDIWMEGTSVPIRMVPRWWTSTDGPSTLACCFSMLQPGAATHGSMRMSRWTGNCHWGSEVEDFVVPRGICRVDHIKYTGGKSMHVIFYTKCFL